MSDAPILFEELPAGSGKLGRVTLSVAATLNSLTLEMVDLLQESWMPGAMTMTLPRCLSKAPVKKPSAPVVMCRRCTNPPWPHRVDPATTRRISSRGNTA